MNSYRICKVPVEEGYPGRSGDRFQKSRLLQGFIVPPSIIRYVYYAFIFSLPLESADIALGEATLSRMLGLILVAVTMGVVLLHGRRFCLEVPKAFWWFVGYLVVYAVLGLSSVMKPDEETVLTELVIQGIKTLIQLLIFLLISYNLMRYDRIVKGTLMTLALSCIFVAVLQYLGMTGGITTQEQRTAAFDANPNFIATILSLGLLILVGLAYGREKTDLKARLLFLICSVLLGVSIVVTGSRGATIAIIAALMVFFLPVNSLRFNVKIGLISLVVIGFLGWLSYKIDAVRERWEMTYFEGDTAGRDKLFSAAWEMFLERPIAGWGPLVNGFEIGSRLGVRYSRDPHNTYLMLLTETGLLGTVPFLVGLWFCWCAAWKARHGIHGSLPISLLCFFLLTCIKGTYLPSKLLWTVLAYALASGGCVAVAQRVRGASPAVAASPP